MSSQERRMRWALSSTGNEKRNTSRLRGNAYYYQYPQAHCTEHPNRWRMGIYPSMSRKRRHKNQELVTYPRPWRTWRRARRSGTTTISIPEDENEYLTRRCCPQTRRWRMGDFCFSKSRWWWENGKWVTYSLCRETQWKIKTRTRWAYQPGAVGQQTRRRRRGFWPIYCLVATRRGGHVTQIAM